MDLPTEFSVQQLVQVIEKVAKVINVPPQLMDWNQFQQGLSTVGLKADSWVLSRIRALGGFSSIRNAEFGVQLEPSAIVTKDKASISRKLAQKIAFDSLFTYEMQQRFVKEFATPIYKLPKLPKRPKKTMRNVHCIISDTHFGSNLLPEIGVRKYTSEEEAASVATLVKGLLDFKTSYRGTSKLYISLIGDVIAGIIHSPQSYAPLSEQMARAIHVLGRAFWILASEYPEIEVNCATGNHERRPDRHRERASADKWDSYASVIYYAIKQQMLNVPNFKMNIPKTPYFTYETFGHKIWATHGDTVIKVPNLGPINPTHIEDQVNRLNANTDKKVVGLLFGHSHSAAKLTLSNGVTVIVNPPLIPADQYAQSIGIASDSPVGQQVWESVPEYPFGDLRTVWVSESDRQNKENLKIIPPYSGF